MSPRRLTYSPPPTVFHVKPQPVDRPITAEDLHMASVDYIVPAEAVAEAMLGHIAAEAVAWELSAHRSYGTAQEGPLVVVHHEECDLDEDCTCGAGELE